MSIRPPIPDARRRAVRSLVCALAAAILTGAAAAPQTPAPPWSDAARLRVLPGWVAPGGPADAEQRRQARSALVRDGEQALLNADAVTALGAFERAANLEHAADIEIGLVRSMMQAGEYRRAVAFCSHTAGAHRTDTGGAALYAWLLHAGGQAVYAQRLLDEAERYMPGDARLAEVRSRLAVAAPVPGAALLQLPARLAPYASPAASQPAGRVVSSGVLVDGGRAALVPLASLPAGDAPTAAEVASTSLWVRNGLGQTVAARVARRDETLGLALLRLDTGLPAGDAPATAVRDAFAGSPASAIEYSTSADAAPAWPLLHQGFLGMPDAAQGWQRLGVTLPAGGPRGGPVFDAAGRLAGLALPPASEGKADRLLPLSLLRARFAEVLPGAGDMSAVPRVAAAPAPLDAVYENGLRVALQVIVPASP